MLRLQENKSNHKSPYTDQGGHLENLTSSVQYKNVTDLVYPSPVKVPLLFFFSLESTLCCQMEKPIIKWFTSHVILIN